MHFFFFFGVAKQYFTNERRAQRVGKILFLAFYYIDTNVLLENIAKLRHR